MLPTGGEQRKHSGVRIVELAGSGKGSSTRSWWGHDQLRLSLRPGCRSKSGMAGAERPILTSRGDDETCLGRRTVGKRWGTIPWPTSSLDTWLGR